MACRLRRITRADLEMVRRWRMLPEITRYMYTSPEITAAEQAAWFERIDASSTDLVWIIELVDGGVPVGLLSLSDIDLVHRRACWAYYIAESEARGKGLARTLELNIYRYVFETLGLNRLWCEVLSFNDKVVAMHEKFGSKVEGILRQHIFKDGQSHDVVRMAVLAEDWPSIRDAFPSTPISIEQASR